MYFSIVILICTFHFAYAQADSSFYQSGNLKSVGRVQDGVKSGTWRFYYTKGALSAIENYEQGKLSGKAEYFYLSGNPSAIEQWKNDQLTDSAFYFYENGQLEKKGVYKKSQYD